LGKTSPPEVTHSTASQEEGNTLNEELDIDMNKKLPSVEQTMKDQEAMEQEGNPSGITSDGHTPSNASPTMNQEKGDGLDDVSINENEKLPALQDQKQNDQQFEALNKGYSLLETQESDITNAPTTNQAAECGAGMDNISDDGSQFVNVDNTSTVGIPSRRRRVYGRRGTNVGNRSTESGCSSRKDIRSQGEGKTNCCSCTNNDQPFVSASLKTGESVEDESKREKFVETSVSRKDNTDKTSLNIISRIEVLQQEGQEEPIIEQPRRQSSRNTKETGEEVTTQLKSNYTVTERRSNRKKSAPELFVARPSILGVGIKEGDKEFLTASTSVKKDDNSNKKTSPKLALNKQVFLDQHNDLCEVCGAPGELLCCASCNLVFHMDCVLPKLHKEPSDDWRCAYCVADDVGGDSSEKRRAIQACKDMEKTRELLQAFSSRPVRARSKPELFVARPSKSGVGVQEGDKEFLSGSSAAKKLSSEMRVKEGRDKPKRQEFMPRPRSTPKVFVSRPSKQSVGVTSLPTICPEVAELKILPKKDRLKKESGHPLCKVEGCTKVGQGSIRDDMCKGHFTLFKKAGRSTKETGEEADKDSSTYLVGKGAVAAEEEEEEEEEDEAICSNVAELKIVPIQDRIENANGIPFCKVEGCPKQGRNESDQMCRIHYNMFQKAGRSTKESDDDVEEEEPLYPDVTEMKIIPIKDRMKKANGFPFCKVEGCPKQGRSESDQMCRSHFTLFKKAGRSTNETGEEEDEKDIAGEPPLVKRGRGRPKKNPIAKRPPFESQWPTKRGRGRKRSQYASTDMAKADSLERAQEPSSRPVRARTKPEQFVARPSKQSVGVEEGDREFLARTTCNSITTNKKYRVEENSQRVITKESDNNVEPSSRPTRTRTKPELFVARPSKSGIGIQEGDEEFLAGTSAAAAAAAEKKRSLEVEEGSWECLKCDTFNGPTRTRCTSCMGWKGGRIPSYVDESLDEQSDDKESESSREQEDCILDPTLLTAGLRIVVDVKDSLFKATVVKYREDVEGKNVLIHYDGLKKTSLHWISADMIRKILKEEDEEEEDDSSSSDEESYSTCESSKKKLWELTKIFTLNEINRKVRVSIVLSCE